MTPPEAKAVHGKAIDGKMIDGKAADGKAAEDLAGLPFEAAMKELEGIVDTLEKGSVPLEESIAIYERGEVLKAHCDALLRGAETRIAKIALSRDGKPIGAVPLDED